MFTPYTSPLTDHVSMSDGLLQGGGLVTLTPGPLLNET